MQNENVDFNYVPTKETVLNAIDLEALLERNLKIIQEASKAKTTKQFNETVKKLNFNFKSVGKNAGKAVVGGTLLGGDE